MTTITIKLASWLARTKPCLSLSNHFGPHFRAQKRTQQPLKIKQAGFMLRCCWLTRQIQFLNTKTAIIQADQDVRLQKVLRRQHHEQSLGQTERHSFILANFQCAIAYFALACLLVLLRPEVDVARVFKPNLFCILLKSSTSKIGLELTTRAY